MTQTVLTQITKPLYHFGVVNLFSGLSGTYEIIIIVFGTIATMIIAFSYLPQFISIKKTKGTSDLSFLMWLLVVIAEFSYTIWGILYLVQGAVANTPQILYNMKILLVTPINHHVMLKGAAFIHYIDQHTPSAILNQAHHVAIDQGLINGLSLFVSDLICLTISNLIFFFKVKNMVEAKQQGITEHELCLNKYHETLKDKDHKGKK